MRTAYIAYGFMEGPMHGRRMRKALLKRGYAMAPSSMFADVVISHSGGYQILPELAATQLLLAIDPALDRTRSQVRNAMAHIWYDLQNVLLSREWYFWVEKSVLNWFYLAVDLSRMHRITQAQKANANYVMLGRRKTAVTKGCDTSWRSSDPVFATAKHFKASHDDCWLHPERYLELLDAL